MGEIITHLARLAAPMEIRTALVLLIALAASLLSWRSTPGLRNSFLKTAIVGSLLMPLLLMIAPSLEVPVGSLWGRALEQGATLVIGAPVMGGEAPESTGLALLPAALILLWMGGTAMLLTRMMLGMVVNGRIVKQGAPVENVDVLALADRLARQVGLKAAPTMATSDRAAAPYVWGWLKTTVVLPTDFETWGSGRIETTLLHEFYHIARNDHRLLVLATLGTALHWPNPLIWLTRRMFRNEAERACDDGVMRFGGRATDYAEHLLATAAVIAHGRTKMPMSMTLLNKSLLEGRLMRILSMNGTARTARPWAIAAAAALLAVVTVGAASIQMQPADPTESLLAAQPSRLGEAGGGDDQTLPAPDDFVAVEKMPEMIHMEPPAYPPEAKEKGIEGSPYVQALISKTGKVVEVRLGKSSGHDILDKAALAAASKCLYKPATQKGKPVAVWVTYKIEFTLSDGTDSSEN